jgi:adenylate cyclase
MKLAIAVSILTGLILVLLAHFGLFYTWNLSLTDSLYGGKPALQDIKIITIDDKSLQEIGRWPWSRTVWIDLLQSTQKAKVVAFDIAFFEPTADDDFVAEAMRKSGNVIIAHEYDFSRKTDLMPAPGFNGIQTATINIFTDQEGVSRSIPVMLQDMPSMALAAAQKYVGKELSVPTQKMLVNFAGEPNSYRTYPAADVIMGRITPEEFENSIVFIGATAPDLHDDYLVPTSHNQRMPGVEIHAHATQTILTKQYLHYQDFISVAIIILVISTISGLLYGYVRIRYSAPLLLILLISYFVAAIFLFKRGIILNLIYPSLTVLSTSLTTISYIAAHENKNKKYILSIFGRYVSKDVVDHLLKSEKAIELGGVEKQVTALFADIRGFTAMSEKMTPHQVITFLNHYFGDMTDSIFAHNGTLDKYVGDALFALWGSPLPDKDHAYNAVKCALAIQERLKTQHRKDIPPINLGIGICSGPAVVGNMGSAQRQEFTAIGDTINTASRLSGVASGGEIIITESTYKMIKDKVDARKLEPLKVKGKEKLLIVYEVIGLHHKPAK